MIDDVWYYVEKKGISIYHWDRGRQTEVIIIPWRMVKRAVADHAKAKSRKSAGESREP